MSDTSQAQGLRGQGPDDASRHIGGSYLYQHNLIEKDTMMAEHISNLKVITVMEPLMCLTCKSAHIADVLFSDGATKKMFYCSRLDCDNWSNSASQGTMDIERKEAA